MFPDHRDQAMRATDRYLLRVRTTLLAAGLLLGTLAGPGGTAAQGPPAGRVVVSDVIFKGNRQVPTDQIRSMVKTRPNQDYVPELVQQDARDLYNSRQFGNVWVETEADGPGRL